MVGRWMSVDELATMQRAGQVQYNEDGVSYLANPVSNTAYPTAAPGSVYVEYGVPAGSV